MLTPRMAMSIKEEPGEFGDEEVNGGTRGRKGRKRRLGEDSKELVQDDDEDEDYVVQEDYYNYYQGRTKYEYEDYDYNEQSWEDEEGKGYFVEERYDDSGTVGNVFHCAQCDFSSEGQARIERHVSGHSGCAVGCRYPGCNFATDHPGNLTTHEGATHLRWVKKAFAANSALLESRVSQSEAKWICSVCGHNDATKAAATCHVSHNHAEGLEEVACRACEYSCNHPKMMRDHIKVR